MVTVASRRLPAVDHARKPRMSGAVTPSKVSLDSCNLGIANDLGPFVHLGPDQGGELLGRVRLELVARPSRLAAPRCAPPRHASDRRSRAAFRPEPGCLGRTRSPARARPPRRPWARPAPPA